MTCGFLVLQHSRSIDVQYKACKLKTLRVWPIVLLVSDVGRRQVKAICYRDVMCVEVRMLCKRFCDIKFVAFWRWCVTVVCLTFGLCLSSAFFIPQRFGQWICFLRPLSRYKVRSQTVQNPVLCLVAGKGNQNQLLVGCSVNNQRFPGYCRCERYTKSFEILQEMWWGMEVSYRESNPSHLIWSWLLYGPSLVVGSYPFRHLNRTPSSVK